MGCSGAFPLQPAAAAAAFPAMASLDALAPAAWRLEVPMPHERRGIHRAEGARLVDGLLARVARGRGALAVAIGERLDALSVGDRLLRLGYSNLGDYARERLGMAGGTARGMARLARALRDRPLLAAAVRCGEVSARRAQALLPVALGPDEPRWVERARMETVRELEAAVRVELARGAEAASCPDDDEPWERAVVSLPPAAKGRLDEAMELAGRLLGAAAPRWQRLEAICQEYLGAHVDPGGDEDVMGAPAAEGLETAKAFLEEEMRRWWFLEKVAPVAAPAGTEEADPFRLDGELRGLVAMGERWDELVGHLGLLVQLLGLWREMGFASFGHYCEERLGMAGRTVEQRVSLERRLHALPALRKAMREGRVSYEKARLVASRADDVSVDEWIARAEKMTCVELRCAVEASDGVGAAAGGADASAGAGAQMCEPVVMDMRMPERMVRLLDAAVRAAREGADQWLTPGECLGRIAEHFIDTWKGLLPARRKRAHRVRDRDEGLCQVPGCSRAATHVHHIVYRSHGGAKEPWNEVSVCAAHHLHGIHRGYIRVSGRAPDRLRWELGLRPGMEPLVAA